MPSDPVTHAPAAVELVLKPATALSVFLALRVAARTLSTRVGTKETAAILAHAGAVAAILHDAVLASGALSTFVLDSLEARIVAPESEL